MSSETLSVGRACATLGLCLVVHDTFITLSREIEYIWRKPFGVITVLFATQRWLAVIGGVLFVQIPTNSSRFWIIFIVVQVCSGYVILAAIALILASLSTVAFSTLRIWAIWNHAIIPTLLVLLVSTVKPALCMYLFYVLKKQHSSGDECVINQLYFPNELRSLAHPYNRTSRYSRIAFAVVIACRMMTVVSDFSILAATCVKTASTWRQSLKIKGFHPTLSVLLLRDGTLYFVGLLILNVGGSVLRILRIDDLGGIGYCFAITALSSNLIARFILDLRGAYDDEVPYNRTMSSIQFESPSISSEMGASFGAGISMSESEAASGGYHVGIATRGVAIVNDLLVLVFTWVKTASVWREMSKIEGSKPRLSLLLLRDGSLYFGILLALNIVMVVLLPGSGHSSFQGGGDFYFIQHAISANLIARFILDLRSELHAKSYATHAPSSASNIQVAPAHSLLGNTSVLIRVDDSTWISSAADAAADEHSEGHGNSTDPFRDGREEMHVVEVDSSTTSSTFSVHAQIGGASVESSRRTAGMATERSRGANPRMRG
ncbi:hypothetical protein EIP91_010589 [Steccherinum ochraceum]|uniref:DUF6533 domain-containing protein n=1 Tax=Steccherinum ochraceum TaxID=92696 RepID=A0A4R0RNA4_9APHY|nr:hypothetical protein EIP91_010589 [Steccherinum ochraceum]